MLLQVEYIPIWFSLYFIIFLSILVIVVYLILILSRRKYSFFDRMTIAKYIVYIILIEILLLLFLFRVIELYIIRGIKYSEGMLWMLINSIILGMVILLLGLINSSSSKYLNYVILIVIIILAISGLGYIGVRIVVNIPIFIWKIFDSNGIYGVWFYSLNTYIWLLLIFISSIFEKEKTDK